MKPKPFDAERSNLPSKKYQPPKEVKPEHQEFLSRIGSEILELKKKTGVGSEELCKQAGISRYSYHLLINGQVYWNSQTLLNLLTYFKIDEFEFFSSLVKKSSSM